ncbi:hypothetical protein DPMN_017364 [Dreissena polymorpha]|uniref:Uncharacterized protein n=1 Tax=Dreissena polymorpha TaxID=45954 RepID=A0A9D4S6B3_DREPO|nr:hypothetical protein DPMN_017364 [Dreissena polymorpha]
MEKSRFMDYQKNQQVQKRFTMGAEDLKSEYVGADFRVLKHSNEKPHWELTTLNRHYSEQGDKLALKGNRCYSTDSYNHERDRAKFYRDEIRKNGHWTFLEKCDDVEVEAASYISQNGNFENYQSEMRPELSRSLSNNQNGGDSGSRRAYMAQRSYSDYKTYKEGYAMGSVKEDGAINLSKEIGKSHDNSTSPIATTNGTMEHNTQGPSSPQMDGRFISAKSASLTKSRHQHRPSSSESSTDSLGSPTGPPNMALLLSLAAQHGLTPQQVQGMLMAQAGVASAAAPPPHIQQLLQVQQSAMLQQQQKAHEAALMQLNEQLQMNLLQQSQLIQDKKTNGKQTQQTLQQLGMQQQTIVSQIQQIQLQQRQLLLACLMQPFSAQHGNLFWHSDTLFEAFVVLKKIMLN